MYKIMKKSSHKFNKQLEVALQNLSLSPRLLVATDFDGTISTFTESPVESRLRPVARVALRLLSELPNTFVTIISGRALSDLSEKISELDRVRLIGSHGHEFDLNSVDQIDTSQTNALEKAKKLILAAVKKCPGSKIEIKPHGVVFHFRSMIKPPLKELDDLRRRLSKFSLGVVREGNKVLEYCVVKTDKGQALKRIGEQIFPTITLFIGDDVTDEAAFKSLDPGDVSVKVGRGETCAKFRVNSVVEAERFLACLAEMRGEWLRSVSSKEIDQHLYLSDLRTSALIDNTGTVCWLCAPRLDSAPLFGSLVGGPGSGHFSISGVGNGGIKYDGNTLIGKTDFKNITITDFLDCSAGRTYQRAGRSDFVRMLEGSGKVFIEFAPKFNFGRVPTRLTSINEGLRIDCGQQLLVLISPKCKWQIKREGMHDVARCELVLKNEKLSLQLLMGTGSSTFPKRTSEEMLIETAQFWNGWFDTLKIPKLAKSLVARSALVIRGLCYGPTGSIAAAATTSLPETIGGIRNWDYRYCWPRDASLAASALLNLKAPGPAIRLLDWILEIILDSESAGFLAPLYSVTGRAINGEAEVAEAIGYCGSRPVRIGNLASEQLQLDTLGPIAELMLKLAEHGASLTSEHLQLAEHLVNLVSMRWKDPDSGIWEIRGAQKHYVHSKLMCWYTVHCCLKVTDYLGTEREDWKALMAEIRLDIEKRGYDEKIGSYIAAYDLPEADAALLWIILSGFHPPRHPRSLGTLKYIENNLCFNDGVYRYKFDDSLHGSEGEFIICRSWLIQALAMSGQKVKAERFFKTMLARIGELGLLSEQWDCLNQRALGNYPQAYSHLGLINAACALA